MSRLHYYKHTFAIPAYTIRIQKRKGRGDRYHSWTSVNEYIEQTNIVDIDFGLHLFATDRKKAINLYKTYMKEINDDQCLEDTVQPRLTDDDVRSFLSILGIENKSTLQQMDKKERNTIVAKLKKIEGVSLRQLARITGISKSVIQRIE